MWFLTSPHGEGDKSVFPTDQYIIQKCFIDSPPTVFLIIAQNIPWFNHHPEFEIAILQYMGIPWYTQFLIKPYVVPWLRGHTHPFPVDESPCFMRSLVLATDWLSSKSKPRTMAFSTFFPENMGGGPGFPVKPLTQPIPILRLPTGSPHVCNWWAADGPNRLSRPTGRRGPFHGVSSSSRGSPRWPPRRVRLDWIFHLRMYLRMYLWGVGVYTWKWMCRYVSCIEYVCTWRCIVYGSSLFKFETAILCKIQCYSRNCWKL